MTSWFASAELCWTHPPTLHKPRVGGGLPCDAVLTSIYRKTWRHGLCLLSFAERTHILYTYQSLGVLPCDAALTYIHRKHDVTVCVCWSLLNAPSYSTHTCRLDWGHAMPSSHIYIEDHDVTFVISASADFSWKHSTTLYILDSRGVFPSRIKAKLLLLLAMSHSSPIISMLNWKFKC